MNQKELINLYPGDENWREVVLCWPYLTDADRDEVLRMVQELARKKLVVNQGGGVQ